MDEMKLWVAKLSIIQESGTLSMVGIETLCFHSWYMIEAGAVEISHK